MKKTAAFIVFISFLFSQETSSKPEIHGGITAKYLFQSEKSAGESYKDQDLIADTLLDAIFNPVFEFHYYGSSRFNFNKQSEDTLWSPFENIADARKKPLFSGYVYEAYAEVHKNNDSSSRIRAGRQIQSRARMLSFDGLDAALAFGKNFRAEVYGGINPLFDSRNVAYGSAWLAGAGLDAQIKNKVLFNLDYLFNSDKGNDQKKTFNENYLIFKYRQRFSDSVDASAGCSMLDFLPYEAKIKFSGNFSKPGTEVTAAFISRFKDQAEHSTEFSSFYSVVGTNHPFWKADVSLRQALGKIFGLDAGFLARQLWNSKHDAVFNRSFYKVSAGADAAFINNTLLISLMDEFWFSDKGNHNAVCFDASYRITSLRRGMDTAKISVSSAFDMYKYDEFETYGERAKIQTYSVQFHLPLATGLSMNARYSFEAGLDPVNSVKASIKYEF